MPIHDQTHGAGREAGEGFAIGDRVRKTRGSSWQGIVVGHYSTSLTPNGVCVESERELGSVQIYPVAALEPVEPISYGPGRCGICGWPLADSPEKGCVPGDCSYRPESPAEQRRLAARCEALAAAPAVPAGGGGDHQSATHEGSGSRPADQAAAHPDAARVDPSREALRTIAATIRYWLRWDEGQREWGEVGPGNHIVIPPTWPSRGLFERWIAALERGASCDGSPAGGETHSGSIHEDDSAVGQKPETPVPTPHTGDLDDLARLSEAATQGEWSYAPGTNFDEADVTARIDTFPVDLGNFYCATGADEFEVLPGKANAAMAAMSVNYVRAQLANRDASAPPAGREEIARIIANAVGKSFDPARSPVGQINDPLPEDWLRAADAIFALARSTRTRGRGETTAPGTGER